MTGKGLALLVLAGILLVPLMWVLSIVLSILGLFFPFIAEPTAMFVQYFSQVFGIFSSQYYLQFIMVVIGAFILVKLIFYFVTNKVSNVWNNTSTDTQKVQSPNYKVRKVGTGQLDYTKSTLKGKVKSSVNASKDFLKNFKKDNKKGGKNK